MLPIALTIAGSDPSGGAGIQADLKTFERHGVYGTSVITLVTAQNRSRVEAVFPLPANLVRSQLDCVWNDLPPQAIKIGALGSCAIIAALWEALSRRSLPPLILDPVLVSSSGTPLLDLEGIEVLKTKLFPMATLITPNLPEAEALLQRPVDNEKRMRTAAKALTDYGPKAVLLKGGHAFGEESVDILFDGQTFHRFVLPRLQGVKMHGTGCLLSAAIAAQIASGKSLTEAVAAAKRYVFAEIEKARDCYSRSPNADMGRPPSQ